MVTEKSLSVESVPVDRFVDTSADNPRGKITPKSVAELAESIRALGMLSPIVAIDIDGDRQRFRIIAGHRRLVAGIALGWKTVPTIRILRGELASENEIAARIADNLHHVAPDPLRESALVSDLRDGGKRSLDEVARLLGKSRTWVAERFAIADLPVEVLKKTVGAREPWSLDATIELARLGPDGAASMLESVFKNWKPHASQVRDRIESSLRSLAKVAWKIDDEKLVPAAGSCAKCPKTTIRREALFAPIGDAKDLGRCLDRACFDSKAAAAAKRKLEDERIRLEADKDKRPVLAAQGEWGGHAAAQAPQGLDVVPNHRWSKSSVKGAKPARLLIVEGKGAGKIVDGFVLPKGSDSSAVASKPAKTPISELSPAAQAKRRAEIAAKKARAAVRAEVAKAAKEIVNVAIGARLAIAFGGGDFASLYHATSRGAAFYKKLASEDRDEAGVRFAKSAGEKASKIVFATARDPKAWFLVEFVAGVIGFDIEAAIAAEVEIQQRKAPKGRKAVQS